MDHRQTAIYYLSRGAYGKAEQHLRQWVLSHPNDIYAHMELIRCFHERPSSSSRKWGKCDDFYNNMYNRPNAFLVRRYVMAQRMFYNERLEAAIEGYRATIESGLEAPTVHYSLGVALQAEGRYEEAQEEFETALSVGPLFLPVLSIYGEWLFNEGRFDRLEKLLWKLPRNDDEELYAKTVLNLRCTFADAEAHLERLTRLRKAAEGLRESVHLLNKGEMRKAALTFWPVFRKHKNHCTFIRTMVYLFHVNSWLESGKRRLKDELGDKCVYALYAMGLLLWYEGKSEEALILYDQAIEEGLSHPLVFCAKARVLDTLQDYSKVLSDLLYIYAYPSWLAYAGSEIAYKAFERSDFDMVMRLANHDIEYREYILTYDVSGRVSLAQLECLALHVLMKRKSFLMALSRVESDASPIRDPQLLFRRAMVRAANDDLERAAEELLAAIEMDESVIRGADEDDLGLIKAIAEQMPQSFATAFIYSIYPAYECDLQEARSRLKELVLRFSGNNRIWYSIANFSYLLEDVKSAKDACRQAISSDPLCKDALELLCSMLLAEKDLQGLSVLAEELHSETLPLVFALDIAQSEELDDKAMDIALQILDRDQRQVNAVTHILSTIDINSLEYAQMSDRLTSQDPFNFESRYSVAHKFLTAGMPDESLKRFGALISDGVIGMSAVLHYGLSHMALEDKPSQSPSCSEKCD